MSINFDPDRIYQVSFHFDNFQLESTNYKIKKRRGIGAILPTTLKIKLALADLFQVRI